MRSVTIAILAAFSLQGAEPWIRLKSANFELYTTAGERKGKEAILYFEQMRTLFLLLSSGTRSITQPVRLIAFRNDKEFAAYRPNDLAAAFYLPGNERDHIVMGSLSGEFYPVALHEYTHLIIKHSGANFPLWLNEGIAELYSSTKPIGSKIQIGNIIPGRTQTLAQAKLIPVDQLFAVTHNSPLYNEKDRAGMFYAQSWLLAHMIHFSPDYRPKVAEFLTQVSSGKHSAEAFFSIYGKSTKDLDKDLRAYYRGDSIYVVNIDVKLEKSTEAPEIETPSPFQIQMTLADLLSHMDGKKTGAESIYRELAASHPDDADVMAALGWFHMRHGDGQRAEEFFGKALAKGSKSAKAHRDFAMLLWRANNSDYNRIVSLLRKALQLDPSLPDGNWDLSMAAMNARDYPTAAKALNGLRTLPPDRAFRYFLSAAHCNYELGALPEARKSVEQARKYAKTPVETHSLNSIMKAIEYKENPPKIVEFNAAAVAPPSPVAAPVETEPPAGESGSPRLKRQEEQLVRTFENQTNTFPSVEGALRQVDCLGDQARIQLDAAGKRVAFLIRDPSSIVIRNFGRGTYEFTCGPQKGQSVKVEFTPDEAAGAGVTGIVRAIEFQ